MKLRTSFFDKATFRKDITRFWPIWVLYTVLMLLIMLPLVSAPYRLGYQLNDSLAGWAIGNLLYAILVAQLLFGDLFNARLCYGIHAMPATRTARFVSHVCAGMLFSFVPNLVTAVLMMGYLGNLWYLCLVWLAVITLQYLFFFGVGVLSAVCTGSRLAMTAVYGILNFFSLVIYWFLQTVIVPMMYGVELTVDKFLLFCPVATLANGWEYFKIERANPASPWVFKGFGSDGWGYLFIIGALGIALLAAGWLFYRRRKLESAGSFIAAKWLSPIFLALYTLCAGAFLPIFSGIFIFGTNDYAIPLIVGLIAGFFTGKMLLARTIRVFHKKAFIQLAAITLVTVIGLVGVKTDVLGIVSYVPEAEDIETVTYTLNYNRYTGECEEEDVQALLAVHQWAVDHPCNGDCGKTCVHQCITIVYQLKDGRTVRRTYYICSGTEGERLLSKLPKLNKIY
ncbi:MAG: hypothetical protein E7447_04575 [Ruminococcaceae bacterium]|nr:hypothetical protein [Oscillospiraceae bacterium]